MINDPLPVRLHRGRHLPFCAWLVHKPCILQHLKASREGKHHKFGHFLEFRKEGRIKNHNHLQRSHSLEILLHLSIPNESAHVDAPKAGVGVPTKLLGSLRHLKPVNLVDAN